MAKVYGKGRTGGAGIGRARVIRADGTAGPIRYSVPRIPWWNLTAWLWAARRYFAMKNEDEQWLKSRERSE